MSSVLCLQWSSSQLGCCYSTDNELFAMQDIWESNSFGYVRTLIAQVEPQIVVIPELSDDLLYKAIVEHNSNIEIKKIKAKEFLFHKGKLELLNWFIQYQIENKHQQVGEEMYKNILLTNVDQDEKMHALLKLESVFRLEENKRTVGCIGVILKFISDVEDDESTINIPTFFSTFSCELYMQIDSDTLRSLCIFESETHPSMHQKRGKESLSLFGLLDKTSSVPGKQLLKEWVSRPKMDIQLLQQRHEAISYFISRKDVMDRLRSDMRFIKNIRGILSKIQENKANPLNWKSMIEFARHTIAVHTTLTHLGVNISIIQNAQELTSVSIMRDISNEIQAKISFEMSDGEGRVVVQTNINPELDLLREKYKQLDDYLLKVAHGISKELPIKYGATLNVVYFPQLGYLVTLPRIHSENAAIEGFELQFVTQENYYYKNSKTTDEKIELDSTIGDIYGMILDKEIEIIQELSSHVLRYQSQILECVRAISELDCIVSLAIVALSFNYVQPTLTEAENKIVIKNGRYEIKEESRIKKILAKKYHLDTHYKNYVWIYLSQMTLLFKNILKMVGLIVYMAHIGSFVPADIATIGITDKMLTRIQTSETVSKPQSAFAFDIQQLNRAIIGATCKSLVIIDEFGKGTNSLDGASLFGGIIRYFLSKDRNCPKVLASTHFHAARDGIALSTTEVSNQIVDNKSQVTFLYRIIPGMGDGKSYGIWCASIAGITNPIIERAIELADNFSEGTPIEKIMDSKEKEVYEQLQVCFDQFVNTDPSEMDYNSICISVNNLLN
ncbi:hypothetical protein K501DRAFT_313117 [Backusella circina FSU 941]|nr:hypothetical protein K501DRAFT_313117 [Backusella circina FSU 941]